MGGSRGPTDRVRVSEFGSSILPNSSRSRLATTTSTIAVRTPNSQSLGRLSRAKGLRGIYSHLD